LSIGFEVNIKSKIIAFTLVGICLLTGLILYLHTQDVEVLAPRGPIAYQERKLIFFALILSLFVVIPVFTMTFFFAWKYRETNHKATYKPDWDHNNKVEVVWWGIPSILIIILSVAAWNGSHTLDPYRMIAAKKPQMTIQVIALDWKWLFIYPQQHIATINYVAFPSQTPVDFELTSDAPMNSFWIPQLGGQIYAMPGMSTELHLLAYGSGTYNGLSANISGDGFANMTFKAHSETDASFASWVKTVQNSKRMLNDTTYGTLEPATTANPVTYYNYESTDLFDSIVSKYNPMTMNTPSMKNVPNVTDPTVITSSKKTSTSMNGMGM
jgi:cytochrome o ubiquinol oxidase subunit 2